MGKITFDEIFAENERRIHYQISRLNIRDPHRDFFQEGLCALWNAHHSYKPEKGAMGTYFNFIIRNRLIDLMRKEMHVQKTEKMVVDSASTLMTDGNARRNNLSQTSLPADDGGFAIEEDDELWRKLQRHLTAKQWTWVRCHVIEEMSIREIAQQEGATVEAVKGWAKQTRKKLRDDRFRAKIGWEL